MENNAENKTELKNRLINFYISHKKKFIVLLLILLIILISLTFLKYKIEKNNKLIAEKYVQAGTMATYKGLDPHDDNKWEEKAERFAKKELYKWL